MRPLPRSILLVFLLLGTASWVLWLRRDAAPPPASAEAPSSPPPPVDPRVVEREGVKLEFELRDEKTLGPPSSWSSAVATLTLTDARTGEPLRNARPRAWMSLQKDGPSDDAACKDNIRGFLGGLLSVRPEVDLNAAWLLVMNDDNSISVLNPHVAFSRTKLRAVLTLPGKAADWVLHPDRSTLFVSVPATGQVSVIDTRRFSSRGLIDVGKDAGRLLLSPDARRLYVARAEAGRVTVIDTATRSVVDELDVPAGQLSLTFARNGRELYVASTGGSRVHIFDAVTLESLEEVEVGRGVVALAQHEAAGAVYANRSGARELVVVDTRTRSVGARVPVAAGTTRLTFDPSGRWLMALSPERGELSVIDAASRTLRTTWTDLGRPDTITFTPNYVYVRDTALPRLFLARLDGLDSGGSPGMSEVQFGQQAPATSRSLSSRTDAAPFAPNIEGNGVIVASPADRALFFYTEGMMAPMGSIRNNGREPRAVLLLDRSLREVQPGVYQADVELGRSGDFDVSVLLHDPRMGACLPQTVQPSDKEEKADTHQVTVEPLFDPASPLAVGSSPSLRFRVLDGEAPVPPEEVQALVFRAPGTWQWRGAGRAAEDGTVALTLPPLPEGQLTVVIGAPARGAALGDLPPIRLGVTPTAPLAQETP